METLDIGHITSISGNSTVLRGWEETLATVLITSVSGKHTAQGVGGDPRNSADYLDFREFYIFQGVGGDPRHSADYHDLREFYSS